MDTLKSFKQFITEAEKLPKDRVGKEIGGSTYVHSSYAENHPRIPVEELNHAKEVLKKNHPDHKYNVVRYGYQGPDKGSFSFIHSLDFGHSPEPISGDSVRVNPNGETKLTKQKKDPQIWHHKHEWVGSDYKGFDVEKSKKRSEHYNQIIDQKKASGELSDNIRKRMGTKSVWDNEVVPHIGKD